MDKSVVLTVVAGAIVAVLAGVIATLFPGWLEERFPRWANLSRGQQTIIVLIPFALLTLLQIGLQSRSSNTAYTLLPDCAHLGNKKLEFFDPAEPSGNEISFTVTLGSVPEHAVLTGDFKDVDPDPRLGELVVAINGAYLPSSLNEFFSDVPVEEEHISGWRNISTKIPPGVLKSGNNRISLEVIPTLTGEVDDVNFCNLTLEVKP